MIKLKKGDRIQIIDSSVIDNNYSVKIRGLKGTIKEVTIYNYSVEFDNRIKGLHNCEGVTKDNHGQYIDFRHCTLITPRIYKSKMYKCMTCFNEYKGTNIVKTMKCPKCKINNFMVIENV